MIPYASGLPWYIVPIVLVVIAAVMFYTGAFTKLSDAFFESISYKKNDDYKYKGKSYT